MHVGAHGRDRRALPSRQVVRQQRGRGELAAVASQSDHLAMHDIISGESHELTLDQRVDVRAPGVEKFRTLSRTQTEG